ncbi:hypothetical protein CDV36_015015 [Fusarium kuroshium]|uniref:Uncharacterized protein n=1 Tax=Fusarium kuroshium TaxID=2010991 RepID=A0A3M2RDR9_9HYPO|nr:hypothetical protein CDV36_015015 [Fusarium kuroshium]
MSRTPPDPPGGSLSAGLFGQLRPVRPPPPVRPPRTHEASWKRLGEAIPRTEQEWQDARRKHGFDTPHAMAVTLAKLFDSTDDENTIYKIIFLAACHVESYGNWAKKPKAYADVRELLGNPRLDEGVLERYMKSAVRLVKLLDGLYMRGLLHRAYESILYIPTHISHLRQFGEQPERFRSLFLIQKPLPEIQGSLMLYLPFLVLYMRPNLGFKKTCEALGSRLFDESEYALFCSAVQSQAKDLVPRLPPMPSITPPLRLMQHFNVFRLSVRLRALALQSVDQLRGYNPMPPGAPGEADMYCYELSDAHQAVIDEALKCLVTLGFLVEGEWTLATPRVIHHDSGPLLTPDGKFQVVIPIIRDGAEPQTISVGGYGLGINWIPWSSWSGIFMNQGVSLLTNGPADYFLIRL